MIKELDDFAFKVEGIGEEGYGVLAREALHHDLKRWRRILPLAQNLVTYTI